MVTELAMPRFIYTGAGSVAEIASVLDRLGLHRPLLVTDRYLVNTGVAARIAEACAAAGYAVAVFDGTVPDPTTESLQAGLHALATHDADSVIGLGGGSPMDTAKALAVLYVAGGQMRDYKAPRVFSGAALPVIAIPTTAGSGSEATRFTVISDSETDEKMLCPGLSFLPSAAILDFELTMSMPPRLTADTGIDALTHAIEAYVSRRANAFADGLALAAITAIGRHLHTAYRDGGDRTAREAMMMASMQAGMAFSISSVALVHGMSRPIGAHFHIAHGLSNAMLLPAITAYSVPGAQSRYADCARALGVAAAHADDALAAGDLVVALTQWCRELAVPTPADYGVDPTRWAELTPLMARQALASGSPANNPVVPDAGRIEELYAQVYG